MKKSIGLIFCIFSYVSMVYSQSDNQVIKFYGINVPIIINSDISNYQFFYKVVDAEIQKTLEKEFMIYRINYKYYDPGNTSLYFFKNRVLNLVASVSKNKRIAAIHITCDYSESILDSLNKEYGEATGLTGLTSTINYDPNNKKYSMYAWRNGSILASICRNNLFYNEMSDKKDLIMITFKNNNIKDYSLF